MRINEIQTELHVEKTIETISKKLFNHMYKVEEKVKSHWSEDGVEINDNSGSFKTLPCF